jgi:hypothetical protein
MSEVAWQLRTSVFKQSCVHVVNKFPLKLMIVVLM